MQWLRIGKELRVETDPVVGQALRERRADAGAPELTAKAAVLGDAGRKIERVDVLEDDDVALHAHDFADRGNAAGAVAQTRQVDDAIERRRHLFSDHAYRQIHAR